MSVLSVLHAVRACSTCMQRPNCLEGALYKHTQPASVLSMLPVLKLTAYMCVCLYVCSVGRASSTDTHTQPSVPFTTPRTPPTPAHLPLWPSLQSRTRGHFGLSTLTQAQPFGHTMWAMAKSPARLSQLSYHSLQGPRPSRLRPPVRPPCRRWCTCASRPLWVWSVSYV